ncbi:PAS domain-containing sensor histidine kinase [Burkholderia sp. LA-2-3-30-S1-D2]|uniref:PAS domain-containing sensor histidine kinase n=1 Tax=Burkholderia sp. LA-2-3-30-S1-D2 TaxID=1637862 RepID=UPI00075AF4AD|nr:PAS domain-containing sensor histidine kinase [Burkholderia sp. LA-2-3-30-S1-D2]AOI96251.1 PAS domain-containing sensor histidine kinase [Burkholderia sp. LA-2-3-30-S1-D2]KVE19799.1 PAS domain-containing sensor histidine kinase [Burkholderia sp. LA-2-3-30-S1-D2]
MSNRTIGKPWREDARVLYTLAGALASLIFIIDVTPLDIAIAVLYVVVVLLVASAGSRRATYVAACGCAGLTLLALGLSHDERYSGGALARCCVSLLAIGTTALLSLRNIANTATLRERLQLLDLTHDAIVVYDLQGRIAFWNQGAEALYGWTAEQALGQPVHVLTQTVASVPLDRIHRTVLECGQWQGELQRVRKDGKVVMISSRLALWRDAGGKAVAILATNNDITDRKRLEGEMRQQKDELHAMIDAIPAMVWSSDSEGKIGYVNKRWTEFGVSMAEREEDIWRAVVHPDDLVAMQHAWERAVCNESRFENTVRIRREDGVYRWVHVRAAPLRDGSGRLVRWYGVNADIEARKQAEQAWRRSEALLSGAQRLSHTGSIAMRLPDGTMWWSDETYRIFELGRHMVPSLQAIASRVHPDDISVVRNAWNRQVSGASALDIKFRLLMADARIKHVHYVAHPIRHQNETEYVAALMDITERVVAQEALDRSNAELAHATRVTMLGELAASIAHEVTQPLAAIVTAGDAALRWIDRPEPDLREVQQSVAQMIRDAKRASDIIRQIRAMARKRAPEQALLDLNDVVRESLELVARELKTQRMDVEVDYSALPQRVCGDRVQLQQVVINLVMNAIQAMSGLPPGARRLRLRTQACDGRAHVMVEDHGAGIRDEDFDRLFSVFFTTKQDGMGMGLSICRSIVEAHGGRIWAEIPDGPGTVIQFVLPLDEETCNEP